MTLDRVGFLVFFRHWINGLLDRMFRIFVFSCAIEMAVIVL